MLPDSYAPLGLEAEDIACVRGGRAVFSGVSFRVEPGQLLAVTGPNGAGKSSLLRLLAGLLRPAAGAIRFRRDDEEAATAHYLGHADALRAPLTLRETLRFWEAIYRQEGRVPVDADWDEAAATVGLAHALDLPMAVFSAGQRRRAALARLLVSPRPLWLLDEPASSLDAEGEALLGRLISAQLARGGIIVAATHQALPVAPHQTLSLGGAR
jgi:heme exporter protein A